MKKTIAKMMAAAMLVASMPAMALPTFTVNADETVSVSQVPTTVADTVVFASDVYATNGNKAIDVKLDDASIVDSHTFKLNVQLVKQVGADMTLSGNQYNYVKNASVPFQDNTGAVDKIVTNDEGYPVVTFKTDKLDAYKENTILKGFEPKGFFINLTGTPFEIKVGKQMSITKDTKYAGLGYTEDGSITGGDVTVDKAGHATLNAVSDTNKKVTMLKKKITVSDIVVAGISFPVEKFDDQAFKGAKMKTITAKNVKHLGSGSLRNCKKLRKARLGGSKMRKIHSNAFYDCEKLKNIKFNGKNLKSVGSKAFMKLAKGCTIAIKAPTAKYKKAVKMIKKSGTGSVKFKKA